MEIKNIKKTALAVIICLANYWIWRVFGESFFLGLGLVLLSLLLVFRLKLLTIVVLVIISFFLLKNTFDTNLKYISPLENYQVFKRHEYYAESLGRLYKNRVGLYLNYKVSPYVFKYQRNLAYNLDPNLYFFANHPRERGGIIEFSKFPVVLLPVFIVGIVALLLAGFGFLVFYLIIAQLISAFLFPGYDLGPVLIFPFIVAVIFLGFSRIFKKKYEV